MAEKKRDLCRTGRRRTVKPKTTMNSSLPLNSSGSGSPLWYQYEACKDVTGGYVFCYLVKVFNLAFGVPANIMVMWQVARKKSDSSTSDIFIFNLAIIDTYFCLMTPIELVNRLVLNDGNIWYFQRFAYGMKDTTPLFLTCVCLDRYVAVVHPIVFTSIRDNKIRVAVSMLVWGLMLAYALSKSVLGAGSTINFFAGLILAAFTIMVFCNLSIVWSLRKSVMGKEKIHPMKLKALRTVIITLAIIVFNYLPPVALFPFTAYYSFVEFYCQISVTVYSIMDLSCTIEPLLYVSKMERPLCLSNLPCSCCQSPSKEPET
ncbi:proteinase-activated receptor 3-like [Conger conger]|uniref:proteinase-activated receptor 3-like n=1 Tax=Conger conger TaxID=82655 RepID=UPI002A5A3993|nr:proteinase-activated receptor 3-like [Conger conger]